MIKSLLYRLRLIRKSGKLKILVVDDEPRFAKIIKRVLSSDEYDVQGADTAIAALKRIKREKFDLIIMGIRMPGMSGIEFYHRIEETNRSYLNKIIFATGDYKSEECVDFFSRTGGRHK